MTTQVENVATPDDVTASEAVSATTTTPVEPADPLARVSLDLLAEYRVASEARDAADRALAEHLSPVATALERALSDAITEMHGVEHDLHVNELRRHLPGLAPRHPPGPGARARRAPRSRRRLLHGRGDDRPLSGHERRIAAPESHGATPGLFCAWRAR